MMYNNPELQVSSAKQLMELNRRREAEAQRKRGHEAQSRRLEVEKIALLKESNELAKQTIRITEVVKHHHKADLFDLKPNFFGMGANINEAWRRFKLWRSQ